MKTRLSVAIVTRNHQYDLIRCLGSFLYQTHRPDELIIVDNNSTDETAEIIKNFSRTVSFPVKREMEHTVGYTFACNKALQSARHKWLAFVDDDCILNASWVKLIKQYIERYTTMSVILGHAAPHTKSIAELSLNFIDDIGKIDSITPSGVLTDFEILDPKCSVLNLSFIRRNNILFNEIDYPQTNGDSSDCDLGMQIQQHKGTGIYVRNITIIHKYTASYIKYYKKICAKIWNHITYEQKWASYRKTLRLEHHKKAMKILRRLFKYIRYNKLSFMRSSMLICTIAFSYGLVRVLRFFFGLTTYIKNKIMK